jgi:transposase
MCLKHCKLSRKEQEKLIEYFVVGAPARTAAELVDIHHNSAIRFFHKLREKIAHKQLNRSGIFVVKSSLIKVILMVYLRRE